MAKQNSVNLDITNNPDGFDISGGSTSRKLTVTGADITLSGSGTATITFPTSNTTLAGLGITQSFTAPQTFTVSAAFSGGLTTDNLWVSNGATFGGAVSSNTGYQITSTAINSLTGTSYSLTSADNGKIVTSSSSSSVTLTVPSGLVIGFNATVIQIGTGSVSITGSGVTLNSFENKLRIAGQHGAVGIISYASNTFNVAGALTG